MTRPRIAGPMLSVGSKVPAFKMADHEGATVTNKDLSGKTTVLYFYPKDDTPGCTKEACGVRDAWPRFRKAGIQVFGVSKDDAASHVRFRQKHDLPFPLLTADEATLQAFGVWKEKSMYGRTYFGITRETFVIGPDGKVLRHYPKVAPEEHAEQLLTDLQ